MSRLRAVAQRMLRALQAEDDWIDRDSLIEVADIRLPDSDLDTRMGAVLDVVNLLLDAGYQVESYRDEHNRDFYRLVNS